MIADAKGVWVAIKHELLRFDEQGTLQNRIRFRRPINSLTLDTERSYLWVAVPGHVFILNEQAQDVDRFRTYFPFIAQLEYDAFLDAAWVVVGPYLLRLNAENRDLQFVSRFGVGFKLWRHLSADGQGGVWGAEPTRLTHVNSSGEIEFTFTPFQGYHGKQKLQDLAADPEDGSVWLANETTLRQYSIVGAQQKELTPDLGDGIIRSINRMALSAQTQPPELNIVFPTANNFINTNTPTIELQYSSDGTIDTNSIEIKHNDTVLTANCTANQTEASCTLGNALSEGEVALEATIADTEGNISEPAQVTFTVDTLAPVVFLTYPASNLFTNAAQLTVNGFVNEPAPTLTLTHNGDTVSLQVDANNAFSHAITLREGGNALAITAFDQAGNSGSASVIVTLDTVVPVIPDIALITITRPNQNGQVTVSGRANSVEPGSRVTITNTRTGQSITVVADANGAFTAIIAAQAGDDIRITAADAAGNISEPTQAPVTNLPPDPETVAPPLPPAQTTPLIDATAFLYTGSNPIQTGVNPGTIEARRVAVIRGKVLDKQNNPLPGVTVTVKDHPEFGETVSRADGEFDLAVNGGGVLTLNYEKDDYLPVQRQVDAPWQDYIFASDVVMIQLDPQVTTVDLSSAVMQVAQGTPQTDDEGTRQATLLFPSGTTATMTLPDGTQQALDTLNVRATEYTVGDNGFNAMPAELPPASGYTYAVELSIDEAIAAKATRVTFNQPIPFYVENFLNFPTGEAVPTGYYDREKAVWIASKNGRVIEILSIENGLAVLDVTGNGNPATATELNNLGITEAERQQLATLYTAGQSLWRVPIPHFTAWDHNWPYGPPSDAEPPPDEKPETPDDDQPKDSDDENECDGCNISPQAQTVGEEIPIAGTPYSLHYRSDRVSGRTGKNTVNIPISGASIPASLQSIRLTIQIAGQRVQETYAPQPNLKRTFTWDGLDGFGRKVYGDANAAITVSYLYACVYLPGDNGFGRFGNSVEAIGSRSNCKSMVFPRRTFVALESPNSSPGTVIGHWGLNVYHAWQASQSRLWRGDGTYRSISIGVETVAGNGVPGFSGDGGPATEAKLNSPRGVAVDSVGNLYIADTENYRVRRISPDGIITTVAGNGRSIFGIFGDGGPATQAQVLPADVAVDAAGNLYIVGGGPGVVRRVDRQGIITTIAGGGNNLPGDGGLATDALFRGPGGVTLDAAGNLYIADTGDHRVHQVSSNGIITTYAGTGVAGFSSNSGLAKKVKLYFPRGLALDASGNLYIADDSNGRIRRVAPNGQLTTIAGKPTGNLDGEGVAATSVRVIAPKDVAVDTSGNIYFTEEILRHRVRRIGTDGLITTIAGTGAAGFSGDGGPATLAQLNNPSSIALDSSGNLYIADEGNHRVIRVPNAWLAINATEPRVTSKDGTRQFIFNQGGRHLRTVNLLTNKTEVAFGYNDRDELIQITDGNGNVTTIERDAEDVPTAIVAPDGQRTELTLNADGYLETVANPAGETWRMAYTQDGLMTEFRDPRNLPNRFQYDSQGRLTQDVNAGLGGWTLERAAQGEGYRTTMTTAEGRTLAFAVQPQANGDRLQVNTGADGSVQRTRFKSNGQEITTQPDGTVITRQERPDSRFSMQAPTADVTVRTPSGLTSTLTERRAVSLSNPGDPLSLQSLTENIRLNGQLFQSAYDAVTKTFTVTSPEGRTATRVINERGRTVRRQIDGLAEIRFDYDERGRIEEIVANGDEQRLTQLSYYDSGSQKGFLQSITDAESRTFSFEYDNAGRVTKQTLPDNRTVQYNYDENGNLTAITPSGRSEHVFNYNAFDLEAEYTPPTVNGVISPATAYDYNLDKRLIKVTRPDGEEINFNYNAKAQLASMVIPRGSYTYGYHATTGQLNSITAPDGGRLTYSYDGFLNTGTSWTGTVSGSVTRRYNNNFLIDQRCVNTSDCIDFGYDNDSLLTQAGNLAISRDPQKGGLIVGTELNAVTTSQTYNAFGELDSVDAQYSDTQYFHAQYVRDKLGRIKQKTEIIEDITSTEIYSYDLAGRLETVNRNGMLTTYAYDSNGNRLSKTTGTEVESGTYDDQERLLAYSGCSYEYSDNGELESKTCNSEITVYNYDVLGNLIGVTLPDGTGIEYVIDGRNRRVGKKINGDLVQGLLYANQLKPIAELNPDGSIKSRFVYGTKPNVPDYMVKGSATYRIVSDHLGSPRLVVNAANGLIAQRIDYDEFGNVVLDTNPGFQPFGFAGGLYDQHTKLIRFGARDLDPETGRWTTKDPIGFRGGLNLYSYAGSEPINFIDVNGLQGEGAEFVMGPYSTRNVNNSDAATEAAAIDPATGEPIAFPTAEGEIKCTVACSNGEEVDVTEPYQVFPNDFPSKDPSVAEDFDTEIEKVREDLEKRMEERGPDYYCP